MMNMCTDHFGQELHVGDEVVYPISSGSSAAALERFPIIALVPLIPHRDDPSRLMRQDQASQRYPTYFAMRKDLDKRFVVQVKRKERWPRGDEPKYRKFTIPYTENVIRVPDGC